jgi:hypothetical protein
MSCSTHMCFYTSVHVNVHLEIKRNSFLNYPLFPLFPRAKQRATRDFALLGYSPVFSSVTFNSRFEGTHRLHGEIFLRNVDRLTPGYTAFMSQKKEVFLVRPVGTSDATKPDTSACGKQDWFGRPSNTFYVGSAVDIATGYGMGDEGFGVRVPVGSSIFSSPCRPDRLWRSTQLPIQWVPGALSQGVKRQGSEADQSSPTSAVVKKMWILRVSLCPHLGVNY